MPQIFFLFTSISLGNFKFILSLLQKCPITLEMIKGLIKENSLKLGKSFFKGKNIDKNKFPLSETHFLPCVPLPLLWLFA